MKPPSIAIVTHTDLDGVGSAIIYLIGTNTKLNDVEIVFAEPSSLPSILRKLCGDRYFDRLVILDLSLNADTYEDVHRVLNNVCRANEILWFDHHPWNDSWVHKIAGIPRLKLTVDTSTCTAEVVLKHIGSTNTVLQDFAKAVCGADRWLFNHWASSYLQRLVSYKRSHGWKYHVLQLLYEAIVRGEDVKTIVYRILPIVEKYMDVELNTIKRLSERIVWRRIGNATACIYFRHSEIPNQSIIGNSMLSLRKDDISCDIAVVVHPKGTSISLRSRRCDVRRIAMYMGGGGHPRAAGAPLKASKILKLLYRLPLLRRITYKYIAEHIFKMLESFVREHGELCVELTTR